MIHRIPEELKDYAQWVVWKRVKKNGRKLKLPFSPRSGRPAKVNDPLTWGTYEEACQAAFQYDGLGFVFTECDPFIGIDLDHCVHDDGILTKDAYRLMKSFGSYAEISPSKRGLHIIVKGIIRDGRKGARTAKMEVYSANRFFTITGCCVQFAPIVSGQDILDYIMDVVIPAPEYAFQPEEFGQETEDTLADEEVLARLFAQKNGELMRRLYDGEDAKYGDTSRDDLYFCWQVNFVNGNNLKQTDRIFRGSKRMREKWNEVHWSSGETYGKCTLEKSKNKMSIGKKQ